MRFKDVSIDPGFSDSTEVHLPADPADGSAAYWALPIQEVLRETDSSVDGLGGAEAALRLAREPGEITMRFGTRGLRLLLSQFTSPIVVILIVATVLALFLGETMGSLIILLIVLVSGVLGFWQEYLAGNAIDELTKQVRATVSVLRDGTCVTIPVEAVVRGDVVLLAPGTIIPADCRVVEAENLLIDESALTGESYPALKDPTPVAPDVALSERKSAVFMGTHVMSGTGRAVVVNRAEKTEYGRLSEHVEREEVTTDFERGATSLGMLLVRAMAVLVTIVFAVNLLLHRPFVDALLFSLALAVGLTPQLLPAIVSVSLSRGAKRMAFKKVVVRRLDAIEDFGSMTVLCTDKTGTITEGVVELDAALGLDGVRDDGVLRLALLNASLQRGYPNPLDSAILRAGIPDAFVSLVDELPYDFERQRLSVLAKSEDNGLLITKGALAHVLDVCTTVEMKGRFVDMVDARSEVQRLFEDLSSRGFRVIGIASRPIIGKDKVSVSDENDMTLRGLLAFADPPKATAIQAIKNLATLGVSIRLVTGDNRFAARYAATAVGLSEEGLLTGADFDRLGDDELPEAIRSTQVFAEINPLQKERLVLAFKALGESVGFLGDGINDAAALHIADISLSVDTAVDVAKQTSSIVLLDKSLEVIEDGIRIGRETFANTLKYIRVTVSANFGNVLSMAAASAFLPFLPLLPMQILLLNFMSDIPALAISTDSVDPEQTVHPERWDIRAIGRFMVAFGLLSSVFDIFTFLILHFGFNADAGLFHSSWFIESTATELVAMLVLRTTRRFYRSRPSRGLMSLSVAVMIVVVVLPFLPIASMLEFEAVPATLLAALAGLIIVYTFLNEAMKSLFKRLMQ